MNADHFDHFAKFIAGGRSKRDRPLANNTRAEYRGSDAIAIRLHATDVVTYHRDGRIVLNSGGWRTVTTRDRINGYSPARVYSEHGVWYVSLRPNPDDPTPTWRNRSVAKPFHALDPGPEPVDDGVGCIAGTEDRFYGVSEQFADMAYYPSLRSWDWCIRRGRYVYVQRTVPMAIIYGSERYRYGGLAINETYKQCAHCAAFQARHEAWELAYRGERWGGDRDKGFKQMCEALERFGSREAWQDAYLEDFRATRDARKAYREWTDRNRTLFEDGMEVDDDGFALAPDPTAELKLIEQRHVKGEINAFVRRAIAALEAGLPMPGSGDCWYCLFQDRKTGETWGDLASHTHLRDHMREDYFVPSLFVNAMRGRGYQDAGIYIMLDMRPEDGEMGGRSRRYDNVARALRSYLTARLVPEAEGAHPTRANQRG